MSSTVIRILDGERLSYAMQLVSQCPVDGKFEVIIKEWKLNRRTVQRALEWCWLKGLEQQTGYTSEELHERFKRTYMLRIYLQEQENDNQRDWVELYTTITQHGTKEMIERALKTISTNWASVQQYRAYLNNIESFCQSKGFILPVDPRREQAMGE